MRAPGRPRLLPLLSLWCAYAALQSSSAWIVRQLLPGWQARKVLLDLRNGDDETSQAASRRIHEMGPGVLRFLEPALADSNLVFRQRVVRAIGDFRDPSMQPLLRRYLRDTDDYVRRECVAALGKLDVRAACPDLLDALDDPLPSIRVEAARALGDGVPREALGPLLAALYRSPPDVYEVLGPAVRRRFTIDDLAPEIVRAIAKGAPSERRQALTLLRRCLEEGSMPTDTATRWLVPPLEAAVRSTELDLAHEAIRALAQVDPSRAGRIALAAVQDPSVPEGTRGLCLAMLGELRPAGALDAVLSAIRCGVPSIEMQARDTLRSVAAGQDAARLAACLTRGDFPEEAQEAFLAVLSQCGGALAVPPLLEVAESPTSPVAESARRALLEVVGREGASCVAPLVRGLDTPSDAAWSLVARLLVDATGHDPSLGDPHALDRPQGTRRERDTAAWKAWWEAHGTEDPATWRERAEEEALGRLSHADPGVRQRALAHLDRIGAPSVARSALALLNDPDESVWGTAADLLARNAGEEVRDAVVKRLAGDAVEAERAARLAARIPHASLVEPLLAALERPEADVRQRAIEALAAASDERAVPRLADHLFDKNRDVRATAAAALGQFNDRRVAGRLVEGLQDPRSDVRRNCAVLLARIGDRSVVPDLIPVTGDRVPSVRANASAALEELTGQHFGFTERTPAALMREAWDEWFRRR